ncbi:MAG: hypothetical protein IPK46_00430 [Saprospiraceae bacterium]|nr:hypothetical protein [Saprospiraceae bacterium]
MKTFFLTVISAFVFFSCSSDDTLINIDVSDHSWVVTKCTKDGEDITANFADYKFEFVIGGVLTATRGGSVIKGNWTRINDSSKTKLIIQFENPDYFREISEDWVIVKESTEVLELSDGDSGTIDGKDVLNFKAGN